ncbi:hypothetical protein PT974_01392 [Cladobotryum mycophilum]|uniref:Uncharacterized protein n=1 Tax=Cladobotryum mycophilum TaxID=491253 RepID=A0ABR0T4W2_9HYPO
MTVAVFTLYPTAMGLMATSGFQKKSSDHFPREWEERLNGLHVQGDHQQYPSRPPSPERRRMVGGKGGDVFRVTASEHFPQIPGPRCESSRWITKL